MSDEGEAGDKFRCEFEDGSTFVMPHESWQKAWEMKYPDTPREELKRKFKRIVERYWRETKVPTKFPFDIEGEERENGTGFTYTPPFLSGEASATATIETRAELAKKVMYTLIRAPLLSVAMKEVAEEEGEKEHPEVITLNGTVYNGEEKQKKSLSEALHLGDEEEANTEEDKNGHCSGH